VTGVLADVNARQEPPEKKDSRAARVLAEPRLGLAMLVVALVGLPGARSRVIQHAVENGDTWRILWDDKLAKPRGELIVHAAAATMWTSLCALADVDMTRESDAGRGPVDFKFSAGWHRRALIEVKLLSSSKLFRGADAQLPQYLASEQISCAYYVCLGFTDRDLRPERLTRVRATCAAYEARSGSVVIPRFIDARPKLPASRLTISANPRGNR
jgi:hypothetical protein